MLFTILSFSEQYSRISNKYSQNISLQTGSKNKYKKVDTFCRYILLDQLFLFNISSMRIEVFCIICLFSLFSVKIQFINRKGTFRPARNDQLINYVAFLGCLLKSH